jgi:hypothetical protein
VRVDVSHVGHDCCSCGVKVLYRAAAAPLGQFMISQRASTCLRGHMAETLTLCAAGPAVAFSLDQHFFFMSTCHLFAPFNRLVLMWPL